MEKPRYLSKSRFNEARECPTRLFYAGKPDYGSTSVDDPFLRSLADGGFQVGALARQYYPEGILIETLDVEEAIRQTSEYLERDNVVLFEGAVQHGHLVARVDIMVKRGDSVQLIEVKSKSIDGAEDSLFQKRKKDKLESGWVKYVADVGFQHVVLRRALPQLTVTPYLMLVDKSKRATMEGLHQRFRLERVGRQTKVHVKPGSVDSTLGDWILTLFNVADAVRAVEELEANADTYAEAYANDVKIAPQLTKECRRCPYRIDAALKAAGKKSGFDECWRAVAGLTDAELAQELVVDMGKLKVPELVATSHFLLKDVEDSYLSVKPNNGPGLSFSERRQLQIQKLRDADHTLYFDADGMGDVYASFTYPLHMIDFETMLAAIPFHRAARPYSLLAYQFSHHTIQADGTVAHVGEFLATEPGGFPNYDFVRALRYALCQDDGTVFRYAAHENTVLSQIVAQLEADEKPPADRDELIAWIKTITRGETWAGARSMVDMCELVKRFYYHPSTHGSNSIKYVLPAALNSSAYLRRKYSEPIYGAEGGIKSLNFCDFRWMRRDGNAVMNPYKLLPPLFEPDDEAEIERIYADNEIINGGAAMTAYARMQFTEMSDTERRQIAAGLLKYCELDTFAMVMLYEHWRELLGE